MAFSATARNFGLRARDHAVREDQVAAPCYNIAGVR